MAKHLKKLKVLPTALAAISTVGALLFSVLVGNPLTPDHLPAALFAWALNILIMHVLYWMGRPKVSPE